MTATLAASLRDAVTTAQRLEREQHINRTSYDPAPGQRFAGCGYCEGEPAQAVLTWWWADPTGSPPEATADTCANWDCALKVLRQAEEVAWSHQITVDHPRPAQVPAVAA